ncbi:MAG: ribosome small subunit-dependent GTPase A [Saprospiraceae bacterium]|nr:ribosome small subunit-dependent GTPase A [Bacteroidia bacterium]NNL93705.1 ribosome small subunit-dependent GTPase A [Saprospiraceae bacterium]
MKNGLIIRSTGSWYEVKTSDKKIVKCRMPGKFRLNGKKLTNPVAVGDFVDIELEENQDTGIITKIRDRKNYVIRQSPRKKHFVHIIASNIDQALLIVTISHPKLKQGFIDRFLLMTEPYDIPVHIFFNKGDVYSDDDLMLFEDLKEIYERIGYRCYLVSALEEKGIDTLKKVIEGKTTLFSGQSGVGKSSLINCVNPNFDLKTKDISDYTGKGQHTTTFAELFEINENTHIIDTPGIKTLSFNHLETQDIAHNFKEFFKYSKNCKFDDCLHRNEPKCAVKDAVEEGEISIYRYQNYLHLLDEVEDQNYWERHSG